MKTIFRTLPFAAILILLASCSNKTEHKDAAAINVKTIKVSYNNSAEEQEFPFISQPYRTSELSFRVGGPVNMMDLHPGNYYRKGDMIASVDSRDFEIRLDKATAAYEQLKSEFDRVEKLYNMNNVSSSTFEKVKANYLSAQAAYNSALNDYNDTKLKAPFDGYIQDVMFEKYQDVKPTQPICSFIDVNKIKIEISVPQQLAVKTKKDDLVNIVFDVLPDDIFVATVEEVSKSPSKNNLSFKLTAIIPNSDSSLIAGMSGKMLINNPDNNNIVAVPQRVIRNNPREGSFVWVTDGSKCILKNVRTGKLLKDGMIEITSGLTSDDIIVSTGLELLTEGKSIEIINR